MPKRNNDNNDNSTARNSGWRKSSSMTVLIVFALAILCLVSNNILSKSLQWIRQPLIAATTTGSGSSSIRQSAPAAELFDKGEDALIGIGNYSADAASIAYEEATATAKGKRPKTSNEKVFSDILPEAVVLLRSSSRNVSMASRYKFPLELQISDPNCSCQNISNVATAKPKCCLYLMVRSHKMGYTMNAGLLRHYKNIKTVVPSFDYDYFPKIRKANDYRQVLIFRDIYHSLASGYLYHIKGSECWLDEYGKTFKPQPGRLRWASMKTDWDQYLSYTLDPPNNNRNICKYMSDVDDEMKAMRAYMEWIFQRYFIGSLSLWALAEQVPSVQERTLSICYEDLASSTMYHDVSNSMLNFIFNGTTNHKTWYGKPPTEAKEVSAHSTSHDPELRNRLVGIIKQIDAEYYNGDIAWLNSVLPCQSKQRR